MFYAVRPARHGADRLRIGAVPRVPQSDLRQDGRASVSGLSGGDHPRHRRAIQFQRDSLWPGQAPGLCVFADSGSRALPGGTLLGRPALWHFRRRVGDLDIDAAQSRPGDFVAGVPRHSLQRTEIPNGHLRTAARSSYSRIIVVVLGETPLDTRKGLSPGTYRRSITGD